MELMFNELSINPLAADKNTANARMCAFAETVAAAQQAGFRQIRSHFDKGTILLLDDYTLHDWVYDKTVPTQYRMYQENLYDKIQPPFINEKDVEIEDRFSGSSFYLAENPDGVDKQACLGLAAAYLYDTLSISFQSDAKWTKNNISITIEPDESEAHSVKVKNVFSKDCFSVAEICVYIADISPIILEETPVLPIDKHIHLAGDHHGKHELKLFWDKMKNNRYVESARSIAFASENKNFIVEIEPAKIEIEKRKGVIIIAPNKDHNTLWVQTTGHNYHETKKIAEELQEDYA
jgi:hypothetical protein